MTPTSLHTSSVITIPLVDAFIWLCRCRNAVLHARRQNWQYAREEPGYIILRTLVRMACNLLKAGDCGDGGAQCLETSYCWRTRRYIIHGHHSLIQTQTPSQVASRSSYLTSFFLSCPSCEPPTLLHQLQTPSLRGSTSVVFWCDGRVGTTTKIWVLEQKNDGCEPRYGAW